MPNKTRYADLGMRLLALLVTALVLACNTQEQPLPVITVDKDKAMAFTKEIVEISPRISGTSNALKAAERIAAHCRELGFEPELDRWTETAAGRQVEFRNVYAELPGQAKGYVVLGTHFDTKLLPGTVGFQGANDSGSSTGLTLEIMRTLKANGVWHGPSILFAFFDGEECVTQYGETDGLHGSKRYVNVLTKRGLLSKVKAMVLLDMVGDADLTLTLSPDDDPRLRKRVFDIATEQGIRDKVTTHDSNILDDHVPFKRAGVPAIDLIDFEYGPNNIYWHTPADKLDKISADSLEIVGNLCIRLLQTLYDF